MEGLAYFVESVEVDREGLLTEQGAFAVLALYYQARSLLFVSEHNRMPQIVGSFISAVKDACRNGMLDWSPRLMLAMYECDIQASSK